jgi:S-formylglutathione hydrolase FrmB
MKPFLVFLLSLGYHFFNLQSVWAARVDTVVTTSEIMQKQIKAVVICPKQYRTSHSYPVLYLLHGFSGNYSDWIKKDTSLAQLSDTYNFIIVCPDGDYGSWYVDSPVKANSKYETYIGIELVKWIDSHYSTVKNRIGRAITGLSMGGHGALYLAFKHQNTFGAAGSMSGGVNLIPFQRKFGIEEVLGVYSEHPERWTESSVVNLTKLLKPNALALIIDCGNDDFFNGINNELHEKLLKNKIPHDYTVRPGGHTWEYWANSIQYQALYFNQFFVNKEKYGKLNR